MRGCCSTGSKVSVHKKCFALEQATCDRVNSKQLIQKGLAPPRARRRRLPFFFRLRSHRPTLSLALGNIRPTECGKGASPQTQQPYPHRPHRPRRHRYWAPGAQGMTWVFMHSDISAELLRPSLPSSFTPGFHSTLNSVARTKSAGSERLLVLASPGRRSMTNRQEIWKREDSLARGGYLHASKTRFWAECTGLGEALGIVV